MPLLFARARAGAVCVVAGLWLALPSPARADAVLLLAEPSGPAASFNPTGHTAVYLTRVCAASPTVLRRCEPGEAGAVISRYKPIAGLDWIAVPVVPYLYAVEQAADAPAQASKEEVTALRDAYRRAHFRDLVPDAEDGGVPSGHWTQLVGAAYDRRIIGFQVATTEAQDDALIQALNAAPNKARFNLLFRNCADFVRDLLNQIYPRALRSSFFADFGLTTPKQVARTLVKYSKKRPELALTRFVIPQIPGSRSMSIRARGVSESLVKATRYVVPLSVVQPWIPVTLAAGYLVSGRFDPERGNPPVYDPVTLELHALGADGDRPAREGHGQ